MSLYLTKIRVKRIIKEVKRNIFAISMGYKMDEKKLIGTSELMAQIIDEVHNSNQEKTAKRLGIARSHLSEILSGKKGVGPKIFEKMGYEQVLMWRKK